MQAPSPPVLEKYVFLPPPLLPPDHVFTLDGKETDLHRDPVPNLHKPYAIVTLKAGAKSTVSPPSLYPLSTPFGDGPWERISLAELHRPHAERTVFPPTR